MLIKQDKETEVLNWLGEGALAVLSSLILASEKKKKGEISSLTYIENRK